MKGVHQQTITNPSMNQPYSSTNQWEFGTSMTIRLSYTTYATYEELRCIPPDFLGSPILGKGLINLWTPLGSLFANFIANSRKLVCINQHISHHVSYCKGLYRHLELFCFFYPMEVSTTTRPVIYFGLLGQAFGLERQCLGAAMGSHRPW